MSLARCWVRVCLRRGIISPRLVVSLPWASPGMSRVMTADTAKAINAERRLNDALVAERNRPPPF